MTEELQNVFGGPRLGKTETLTPGQKKNLGNYRTPIQTDAAYPLIVSLTRSDLVATDADQAALGIIDADVFCRLQYGAGGTAEEVEVDFLSGTTLAIPGTWANVIAVFPTLDQIVSTPAPDIWSVALGCMFSVGVRASPGLAASARRTLRTGEVANLAARTLPIPLRALDVTIYASSAAAIPTTTVNFSTLPTNPNGTAIVTGRTGNLIGNALAGPAPLAGPSSRLPIPNSARSIVILNGSGGPVRYFAIFTVAL